MAKHDYSKILERKIQLRSQLWPKIDASMLWSIHNEGWVSLPRLMPLMMSIMDDMSGKGFPVSRPYLEMWTRLREEQFLALNNPEEMAFHAGFEGQRALRTWKDRIQRLAKLGFINLKPGSLGDLSFALFYNPYHVIKRAHLVGDVQEKKWLALIYRCNELRIFDIHNIDDDGKLTVKKSDSAQKSKSKPVHDKSKTKKQP